MSIKSKLLKSQNWSYWSRLLIFQYESCKLSYSWSKVAVKSKSISWVDLNCAKCWLIFKVDQLRIQLLLMVCPTHSHVLQHLRANHRTNCALKGKKKHTSGRGKSMYRKSYHEDGQPSWLLHKQQKCRTSKLRSLPGSRCSLVRAFQRSSEGCGFGSRRLELKNLTRRLELNERSSLICHIFKLPQPQHISHWKPFI